LPVVAAAEASRTAEEPVAAQRVRMAGHHHTVVARTAEHRPAHNRALSISIKVVSVVADATTRTT
jgi:hypothetical protein